MKFIGTINGAQYLTVFLVIVFSYAVVRLIPAGAEHDLALQAIAAMGAQGLVSTRTPSSDGGTTKTAEE